MQLEKIVGIIGLLACFLIVVYSFRNLKHRLSQGDIPYKVVSHNLTLALLTIFGGLVFALISSIGSLVYSGEDDAILVFLFCIIMGLLMSGFMVPSLSVAHDIYWDNETLEGPNKLFGLSLGKSRNKLYWKDIVSDGVVKTGYVFVETQNGERIYYSPYSNGVKAFRTKFLKESR